MNEQITTFYVRIDHSVFEFDNLGNIVKEIKDYFDPITRTYMQVYP